MSAVNQCYFRVITHRPVEGLIQTEHPLMFRWNINNLVLRYLILDARNCKIISDFLIPLLKSYGPVLELAAEMGEEVIANRAANLN